MKIDLGKVTSIQLTLAISVVPENIAILIEGLSKLVSENQVKISLCQTTSICKKILVKPEFKMLKSQQEVIPIGLVYHVCINVMSRPGYVIVQPDFDKCNHKLF